MSAKNPTFLSAASCFVLALLVKCLKCLRPVYGLKGPEHTSQAGHSRELWSHNFFSFISLYVTLRSLDCFNTFLNHPASFANSHLHYVVSTITHSTVNWVLSNTFSHSSWALLRIRNHSKGFAVTNPSTLQTIKISKLDKTNGKKT